MSRCVLTIVFLMVSSNLAFAQSPKEDAAPPTSKSSPQPTKSEADNRAFQGATDGQAKELSPGIVFHWCPAGTFTMGSPKTELGFNNKRYDHEDQVSVTLTKGFWLAETELTQGQWQKLMGTSPWSEKAKSKDPAYRFKEGADYPASLISYDDAVSYCQKLTSQERSAGRLPQGWKYSLPTEAQWEYACRAGTTTKYSFGASETQLGEYGWFDQNAFDIGEDYAHQVGQKKANPWGLRDMHGNVAEWCSDYIPVWWGGPQSGVDPQQGKLPGGRDPIGALSGSFRVSRGGSYNGDAAFCRSAYRVANSPGRRFGLLGFRLAAVPE